MDFKCEVLQIDEVIRHPNANKLAICKIKGYNCITSDLEDGTPRYKTGDYVVYIPEASLVPEWILKKMGFWDDQGRGLLSGRNGNRVKIIKLRGEYSTGLMYPANIEDGKLYLKLDAAEEAKVSVNYQDMGSIVFDEPEVEVGEDVANLLGITKYEPAIPQQMQGVVGSLFGYTKSYDIESIQNYPDTFKDGDEVVVTEKLHGTLCQIGFVRDIPEEAKLNCFDCGHGIHAFVTSKGMGKLGFIQKQIEGNKDNVYVKMFEKTFVDTNKAKEIAASMSVSNADRLYIFGEIMGPGIQSGYTYNKKTPELRVFDVYVSQGGMQTYANDLQLEDFLKNHNLPRVPVLYKGTFSMQKMIELRDGKTVEGDGVHIREGIVIRAAVESNECIRGLHDGRKQVKFVSPEYKMAEDEDAIG